jgi:hypothetical protein
MDWTLSAWRVAWHWPQKYIGILNGLGYILVHFITNSSGHPGQNGLVFFFVCLFDASSQQKN